jgi:hypothetical protein
LNFFPRRPRYLTLERDAIRAQLDALAPFAADHPRRIAVSAELEADLESVETSLAVERSRNERMHDLHTDFFKVLLWQREMLQEMGVVGVPAQDTVLDRKDRGDQ